MSGLDRESRKWLKKANGGIGLRIRRSIPFAVEKDLEERGLIVRYGRGRNRKWTLTEAGKRALAAEPRTT